MLNIVFYEPEIPFNTGAIARTCGLTHTRLHLIKPLGFKVDDKHLKRAGLDYWHLVDINYYDSYDELLEKYVRDGDEIFDIGCGSGILAIASLKLGAKKALAIDIDEKCIDASFENAKLNNLEDKIEIKKGNLLDVVKGRADLIVSNIIAEIIVDEIKNLKNHMDSGGIFITSGIIKERRQMVIDVLAENGFDIIDELEKNNWVAIVGKLNV